MTESLDVLSQRLSLSLDAFYAGVVRGEQERQEAERVMESLRAAEQRRTMYVITPAPAMNGVGECTGFVIPDYIIQRESGGQPFVKNPTSDAFGCAQTLLRHYYGGACDGLDPYTLDGQRACVDIISNGGTNLNPWRF